MKIRTRLGIINFMEVEHNMSDKSEFAYDVRIIERYMREGKITKNEYQEYLKNLPDMVDESCPLIIDDEPKGDEEVESERKEGESR